MKTQKVVICATLLLIFVTVDSACAYYDVIDLGPGVAYAINDSNQIVGASSSGACLFDSTGGGANINLGPGIAYAINASGQIVGESGGHACLFDSTGGGANTDLGTLGGSYSKALSINDSGQIVGRAENSSDLTRACRFIGSGYNVDLGTLGGNQSIASSINNSGQVVGIAGASDLHDSACLFDITGNGVNIRLAESDSWAYSINDGGQIVGCDLTYTYPDFYLGEAAIIFDETGQGNNIYLGNIGGKGSIAYFINNAGLIVGRDYYGGYRACLFDPTGQGNNINLNYLIDPSSGWILEFAHCINNNGWVVGSGINPDGETHAFLMLPEPATIGLLALGGLVILRRRRK